MAAFDAAGNYHIAYFDSAAYKISPVAVNHIIWNGTTLSTPVTIFTLGNSGAAGGIALTKSATSVRLYAAVDSPFGYARGGDIASFDYASGAWSAATTVRAATKTYALAYPIPIDNPHPNARVVFAETATGLGALAPTAYGGNLRQYAYGDNGPLLSAYTEEPELTAWVSRFATAPSAAHRLRLNEFIRDGKAANYLGYMDAAWLAQPNDPTGTAQNIMANKANWTVSGAITFGNGYAQGDGVSAYVDTGFNPSTFGGKYTETNALMSVFRLDSGQEGAEIGVPASSTGLSSSYIFSRNTSNYLRYKVNTNGSGVNGPAVTNAMGLSTARRTASNSQQAMHADATATADATGSNGLPNFNYSLFRDSATYVAGQVSFAAFGAGATVTPVANAIMSNVVKRYLYEIGTLTVLNTAPNMLRNSNDFTQTTWTKGTALTVTAAYAAGPDGVAARATRLQATATDSTARLYQSATDAYANTHNTSVYIKSNTGVAQGCGINGVATTVPTTWTRISAITGAGTVAAFALTAIAGPNGEAAFTDILIAQAMANAGNTADLYQETT